MSERDAPGSHGAVRGAAHVGVGAAFESLIQRAGAAGHNGDSGESLEKSRVERTDSAAERAEIKTGSGGDDDHQGDAEFEEGGIVGNQRRRGLRGGEDVIGCRGVSHVSRIQGLPRCVVFTGDEMLVSFVYPRWSAC